MSKHEKHHKTLILGIDNALQTIHKKVANNISKLTEIDEQVKKDKKKLKEVEDNSPQSAEQKEL